MLLIVERWLTQLAVVRCIEKRNYFLGPGHPQVKEFEKCLSRKLRGVGIVGVNSGTDALALALKALDVLPGDEVIVPAFSFVSTASAVAWIGARPVFTDISSKDFAIDPDRLEEKITTKTKAIIVAHLYGQPSGNLEEILAVAQRNKLYLIEDAAQAFGAKIKIRGDWRMVGTVGEAGCFSFAPNKILASLGNGGAVAVKDSALHSKLNMMRLYGARRHYFEYPWIGINSKLQEIQASALLVKMRFVDYWLNHRKVLANTYFRHLGNLKEVILPKELPYTQRVWYRYVIRAERRDELFEFLKHRTVAKHLQPSIQYPIILPQLDAFSEYSQQKENFPEAKRAVAEVLSLPLNPSVSQKDAEKICGLILNFYGYRI